ncbi:MAG: DUF2058 family protein [Rudaea sp.]
MTESLRDQLLKSGLVKKLKDEAKPAPTFERPKNSPRPQQTHRPRPQNPRPPTAQQRNDELDLARAYAIRAKIERDERENAQRETERVAREKKERKAKLTELLNGKSVNNNDADVPRHFPHGNKIRRVYCTHDQLAKVNAGELAVVQLAGRYLLVDRDTGLKAQAIQAESLVLLCDPNAPPEDDVPADLVW